MEWICKTQDLEALAQDLVKELTAPFVLWLEGEVGAGKTTLTGHILRALGLPQGVPVTSPSCCYANDYEIGGRYYAHLDLYRIQDGALPPEGVLADDRQYQGLIVEWPGQASLGSSFLPTHRLKIRYREESLDERSYLLI
jgi:tRNA threonylcarbamoyladenosine biosynthesis protein TsaE